MPITDAELDVSIPDQKRQGEACCASRGYQLIETYVEPGASATNDRRPEFQRMTEAGTSKPAPFDIVIVHSFSRFFRDHFELEFYVRRLAKNGVRLVSIDREVRIIGTKINLLQTLTAASSVKPATPGVRSPVLKWRRGRDSNPRDDSSPSTHFPGVRLQPLGHPSQPRTAWRGADTPH